MDDWLNLILAFAVFLLAHWLPMRPPVRAALTARLGHGGYLAAYSVMSLVLLGWLIFAAGRAPYVPLWPSTLWQRWAVNIAMPVAIILIVFGIGASNPFGMAGSNTGFDPRRPGIAGVTRHPVMWGLALWAGAHLLASGDVAHVLLFGGLTALATGGIAAGEARARRQPGFAAASVHTSLIPGAALLSGRWRPRGRPSVHRLLIALFIWRGLLMAHGDVIGVTPLP